MGIEIEVGLENAPQMPAAAEEPPPRKAEATGLANPKLQRALLGAGMGLLAVISGLYFYYHLRETTDDAQVDGHVTPVAAKVYGRVEQVLVEDNQAVKAGQVLVRLDTRDFQANVDQARAAVSLAESEARAAGIDVPRTRENMASETSSAEAQLAGAEAELQRAQGAYDLARTADLAYAQANVAKSRANAQLAKADLERFLPLAAKDEISKQQLDAARANAEAAGSVLHADQERLAQAERNIAITEAAYQAAKARVDEARAGIGAARANLKQVTMRSAEAQAKLARVEQARAALTYAELTLQAATVVAPVDGVVTRKQVEPGQVVQGGQGLLVLVPLHDVWVTANFKETQLRRMKPGQKAYVEVDTYGRTFTGHVDSIAGATGARLSLLPAENATGNFVKVVQRIPVKIVLDAIPAEKAVLRPGMNADVTVVTK
ncbi:MAG: HlyD family secretion protein [Acidobacteriia bacterium]|nr:HlyD family secretion protein [Terriglobia bacterium]